MTLTKDNYKVLKIILIIYIYQTLLSKATYNCSQVIHFHQYVCSLGIEPTIFCAADAMLYHWATQEHTSNYMRIGKFEPQL